MLFCGHGLTLFYPKRCQFQKNTLSDTFIILNSDKDDCFKYLLLLKLIVKYSPTILFSDQYPNRYHKSSRCGPFEAD